MKRNNKRLLSLMCVLVLSLSVLPTRIYATTNNIPTNATVVSMDTEKRIAIAKKLGTMFEDSKVGTTTSYKISNKQAVDITDSFKSVAKQYYSNSNWLGLYYYFESTSSKFEKFEEVWTRTKSDLGKTWYYSVVMPLAAYMPTNHPEYPLSIRVGFSCDLTGSIYYDPNTMRITSTSGPSQLNDVMISTDGVPDSVVYNFSTPSKRAVVSADRLSANFYFSMHITASYRNYDMLYDFGNLGGSSPIYTAYVS